MNVATPDALPITKAMIHEVGPRDGFQMIEKPIATDLKVRVIGQLAEAGFDAIQLTSFVHPKAVPQMFDSAEIVEKILDRYGPRSFSALVPNFKGALRADEVGLKRLDFVISVSEAHNWANVGMDHNGSWEELRKVQERFPDSFLRLDLATLFSCPFAGQTPLENAVAAVEQAVGMGIEEIGLSDTMGEATPRRTREVLQAIRERFPDHRFVLHFHDTEGMALLNYFVAAQMGFDEFESSVAGLGGCPFAPGASGNLATEDLVNMFNSVGVRTGINLEALLEAARTVQDEIEPHPSGRLVNKVAGKQRAGA